MIRYLKYKYYWYKTNRVLADFLKPNNQQKILLYGYPKSGNTWLRFLLYNYCNLLLNPQNDKTITYKRLNILQNNVMDRGTTFSNQEGFPLFYRTHVIYRKEYELFSSKIFIHRNPLDTLISAYYFYKDRDVPFLDDPVGIRYKLNDIDFYISYKINDWINFYRESIKHADIIINYSNMINDCEDELSRLVSFLGWNIDHMLIKRSVSYSSFDKINSMAMREGQQYGNGPSDGTFYGKFTRDGTEGQFYSSLRSETIESVLKSFPEFRKLYPNIID